MAKRTVQMVLVAFACELSGDRLPSLLRQLRPSVRDVRVEVLRVESGSSKARCPSVICLLRKGEEVNGSSTHSTPVCFLSAVLSLCACSIVCFWLVASPHDLANILTVTGSHSLRDSNES